MQKFYMDVAARAGELSRCERFKVGSVIVKDGNILSYGWNGTPSGWDNCCEEKIYMDGDAGGWLDPETIVNNWPYIDMDDNESRYKLQTIPEVLHSESNAISKLAKSHSSGDGATMFCTLAPCLDCAKLIHQSGIIEVYYQTNYRCTAGIEFLQKVGVKVLQIR